jgi:hypothetical protein
MAEQWERLASELAEKLSDNDQHKFSDCSAHDFENLSLAEYVHRCREMAKRARAHAQSAAPSHRDAYSEFARLWGELADDIERAQQSLSSGHPFSGHP